MPFRSFGSDIYSNVFMPSSNSCARCYCNVPSQFGNVKQSKQIDGPFLHQLVDLQQATCFIVGTKMMFDLAVIGSSLMY